MLKINEYVIKKTEGNREINQYWRLRQKIATAKKSKKHLMEISEKVHCEDLSFVEKWQIEWGNVYYNQSTKIAQNDIKLKNDVLKEIGRKNIKQFYLNTSKRRNHEVQLW